MVFQKEALDYFDNGMMECAFIKLAEEKSLSAYQHDGFWRAMDTYQEMEGLNELWKTERPWAMWEKNGKQEA